MKLKKINLFINFISLNIFVLSCSSTPKEVINKVEEIKEDISINQDNNSNNKQEDKEYKKEILNTDLDSYTLKVNQNKTIIATLSGIESDYTLNYLSDNNLVATINDSGIISGIKKGNTSAYVYYDKNNNTRFDIDVDIYKKIEIIVESNIEIVNKSISTYYSFKAVKDEGASTINPKERFLNTNINIYKINSEGDIPYMCLDDYYSLYTQSNLIYDASLSSAGKVEKEDNLWKITNIFNDYYDDDFSRDTPMYIDIENNLIFSDDFSAFLEAGANTWSYNVPSDPAVPLVSEYFRANEKTKYIQSPEKKVLDLNKYGINLYEIDDKAYIPINLMLNLVKRNFTTTPYFDGSILTDLYFLPDEYYTFIYSGNNSFAIKLSNGSNQTRYFTFTKSSTSENNYTFSFKAESKRYINGIATFDDNTNEVSFNVGYSNIKDNYSFSTTIIPNRTYKYNKDDKGNIIIYENDNSLKAIIRNDSNSIFASNTFGNNMKVFNINSLLFNLDYFYGLKENLGITSFKEYFKTKTVQLKWYDGTNYKTKDNIYNLLMSVNTYEEFDLVLYYIIKNILGDGHTAMSHNSAIAGMDYFKNSKLKNVTSTSTRSSTLSSRYSTYNKKRNKSPTLIINNNTAIIQFDSFQYSEISQNTINDFNEYVKELEEDNKTYSEIFSSVTNKFNNTFFSFKYAFNEIEKNENIKYIVLDETLNGGGAATTLPFLMSFMSSDPTIYYKDTLTNSLIEFHYDVDLNLNGVFNEEEDSYNGKYKFFILQSNYSFSCATAFPALSKSISCATIIGSSSSGGGACPVDKFTTVSGAEYKISSRFNIMMKDGDTFINDDLGAKVDKELSSDYWYNHDYLNTWLSDNFD